MPLFASYSTARVVSGRLTLPAWGAWVGDFLLAEDDAIPTTGTLTIGNLSLVGSVQRTGPWTGSRNVRLVGGKNGWQKTAPRALYGDPNGVKLATILGDVAAAVGESVSLASDFASQVVGLFWSRAEAPASRTLALTARTAWYIDSAGVTQIGTRPPTSISSDFTIETHRPDLGQFTIATEDPASWVPGAMFSLPPLVPDVRTVSSASVVLGGKGRLRVEVLAR